MPYAKAWKVTTTQLQSLIDAADSQGYCMIEVYHGTSDKIADCELWLKYSTAWGDQMPIVPPVIPLPV